MCSLLLFSVFITNMLNNSAHLCESSGNLMEDDIFMAGTEIIAGVHSSAMLADFYEDITDSLWPCQDFPDVPQLTQQYHIPQISISSLHYGLFGTNLDTHCRSIPNSAFGSYRKQSRNEVQLCSAPALKQKLLKRCFDFLRRTYKNSRDKSSWKANGGLVEESYAFTHKLAERNRRTKLSQQFLALRSLLPHNPKKVDKIATLTNAISELNRQKLRIHELEQLNQSLTNAVREKSRSEGCSSLSNGCEEDSRRDELKHRVCEEADVLIEKTSIPDEVMIEISMKKIAWNSNEMEGIVRVEKMLRDMELKVVRIQWRELGSENQLIEGTIRRKTKGEVWETKQIKRAVKRALTGS